MDIRDDGKCKLSNFTSYEFIFDGVLCKSMEGLLQSFKYKNINSQEVTCGLIGKMANKKGLKRDKYWNKKQYLWWRDKKYKRDSKEYQIILDRAYNFLYQNEKFRRILDNIDKGVTFTYNVGKDSIKEATLTIDEFCSRLQYLKDFGEIPIRDL